MNLSIDFISREFDNINSKYFKNKLLKPRFEITHVKGYLGQYHWVYSYDDRIFRDSVIRISDMYDRTSEDIINTLAHEMIHLYIRQNKIKDSRAHHGSVFHAVAGWLNSEGGFHIASTDSVEGCGLRRKEGKMWYVGCYFSTRYNKYFQFVMNKNKVSYYTNLFETNHNYKKPFIFTSCDDKAFAHLPACRSAIRGVFISKGEFDRRLREENVIYGISA